MDEAFVPLSEMLRSLLRAFGNDLVDQAEGVRLHIAQLQIDSPIELDVTCGAAGPRIGAVPPLYYVDTSVRPSYHRIRMLAEREDP